jgi:thiamine biosynthesis lipoprotein
VLILSLLAVAAGYLAAGRIAGFGRAGPGVVHRFETMRTLAKITIPSDSGSRLAPRELAELAEGAIREVDGLMSPSGENSDVRRLNEAPAGEWVEVDPLTWKVVMEALRWHRLSGGAFDPTIGPLKRLFRFDRSEAAAWPDPAVLEEARSRVGADKLLFDREGFRLAWKREGMSLDLGALAKGFAVDRAAEVLRANGARNAIIDVGGELFLLGRKPGSPPSPWRTAIRHPRGGEGAALEELELSDRAVATSGDYESFFTYRGRRHQHIIDPASGLPLAEGVAGVTAIHPESCLAADALATTLSVLGPERGEEFIRAQAPGLFSRGVRVIMFSVGPGGGLSRREFSATPAGVFLADGARPAESGR